jgi:hypothetical protein
MRLLPTASGPGRRCPLFWSMGQTPVCAAIQAHISRTGTTRLSTNPSASAPAPCAGCAAARGTAARGAAPTGGRGWRRSRAETWRRRIFIRGGRRLLFRSLGLGRGPGTALLIGGGGVGCSAVCASPGGCRVLLAARWGRFFAVGHDGVVRCGGLGERPTAICMCGCMHGEWAARAHNARPNGCTRRSSHDPTGTGLAHQTARLGLD